MSRRQTKNNEVKVDMVNAVTIEGIVTYIDDVSDKLVRFGVKSQKTSENGKVINTFVNIKCFVNNLNDEAKEIIDKLDTENHITVFGHFMSSSYKTKTGKQIMVIDVVADDIFLKEE